MSLDLKEAKEEKNTAQNNWENYCRKEKQFQGHFKLPVDT